MVTQSNTHGAEPMSTTDNQNEGPAMSPRLSDGLSAVVVAAFGLALFWGGAILDGLLGVALL